MRFSQFGQGTYWLWKLGWPDFTIINRFGTPLPCFWWRSLYRAPGVPVHIRLITISSSICLERCCWNGFKCNPQYILPHYLRLYSKYLLITHSCTISEYINYSLKNRLWMELMIEFKMYSIMIFTNDPLIDTIDLFHDTFFVYSWNI